MNALILPSKGVEEEIIAQDCKSQWGLLVILRIASVIATRNPGLLNGYVWFVKIDTFLLICVVVFLLPRDHAIVLHNVACVKQNIANVRERS